jgi:hypothetical protein
VSDDAFSRIEAHVVAIGELLEQTRRYRPLLEQAEKLYLSATRVSRRVRIANRSGSAAADDLRALEEEIESIATTARTLLDDLLHGEPYRRLLAALEADDVGTAAKLVADLFADIEPVAPAGPLYLPLSPKRGEGALAPDAAADTVADMIRHGIPPQHAPGAGGDASVRPIRFYERLSGIDAALLVTVDAGALGRPAFRTRELDEVLVYARRLKAPLAVALPQKSPDDWLELRAGGYAEYREKCRAALIDRGIAVVDA